MDNMDLFNGEHKMLTRYKKQVIQKQYSKKSVGSISSDNDEEFLPQNRYSDDTDLEFDFLADDELDMLICEAHDLIADDSYLLENCSDNFENVDYSKVKHNTKHNTLVSPRMSMINPLVSKKKTTFKKVTNRIRLDSFDKQYIKFSKTINTGIPEHDSVSYFKKMSPEDKESILDIEHKIRDINHGSVPLRFKLLNLPIDINIKARALRRLEGLNRLDESSSEYYKITEWITTLLTIPFNTFHELPVNNNNTPNNIQEYLINVKDVLDKSVYGHENAKCQILQIITQWISNPKSKGNIIGLQGPMGNGKTTLAKYGIAKAINRPFTSITLGGASEAALLEGHSYTYEGSDCGRIIKLLIQSKCMNPIIYFDELDKISDCSKGSELVNKLIHLTDLSQNNEFNDRYFENINFDLSRILFIFSFNHIEKINPILLDRMHVIQMEGLKIPEKLIISRDYLIPRQLKEVGFKSNDIVFSDDIIIYIIQNYTNEEGVRTLKKCLENIISKLNIFRYVGDRKKLNIPFKLENVTFPIIIDNNIVDILLTQKKKDRTTHMYI